MFFWKNKKKKCKIGLALGSGGSRGLAHIGVIKVLEENNVPIHYIAGSSIGAVIGGLYAATRDIKRIEKFALGNNWRQLLSLIVEPSIKGGLIAGKKLENFLNKELDNAEFSDLKIPFVALATDFKNGEPIALSFGNVAKAVRCSLSVPLIFKPAGYKNKILVDGGLSEPVPINVVRQMGADIVIAVNLDRCDVSQKANNSFWELAERSLKILRYHLAKEKIKQADIVIEPKLKINGIIGWKNFLNGKEIILEGERAMRLVLPKLKRLMKSCIW